jgi:hypothetical protein
MDRGIRATNKENLMVIIREARVADAVALAPRLREADRRECIANTGITPEFILPHSVATPGSTWALEANGECIGLFGVDTVFGHPQFGIIWMVTSDEILKHRRQLLRDTPVLLDKIHQTYPLLGNHVDARNTVHIRWLKWLGFSMLRVLPEFGAERRPFIEFAKLGTNTCA